MGHRRFAGYVSAMDFCGSSFVRVDVPECPAIPHENSAYAKPLQPAFSKLFNPTSIYAITPCTEQTAREAARSFRNPPMEIFEAPMHRLPRYDDEADFD